MRVLGLFIFISYYNICNLLIGRKYREQLKIMGVLLYKSNDSEKYYKTPASYVKWLEESGIKTVPLLPDEEDSITYEKMQNLDGVLLTGGPSILFET